MVGPDQKFMQHVETGVTTLSRCWEIRRTDGVRFGFTDHDVNLSFDGLTFRAETGLSAMALQQSTGLSIDNSEAIGALSDAAIRDEDIDAGRFDSAEVRAWLVNWMDVDVRWLQFRGTIGEIRRGGGAFRAELRGIAEGLNRPLGRVYQKPCAAVLGDETCRFDLNTPGYAGESVVEDIKENRELSWAEMTGFEPGWFARGRLVVLSGRAEGLWGMIKNDEFRDGKRVVELWEPIRAAINSGDLVRLEAGCDKRLETCRLKFNNILNFQGFPDIPGEDWVMAVPKQGRPNSGGSLR